MSGVTLFHVGAGSWEWKNTGFPTVTENGWMVLRYSKLYNWLV